MFLHSLLPPPTITAQILERGNYWRLPIPRFWTGAEQLAQASKRPSPSAHPIHFARKLVQLALCMQHLNDEPAYDAAPYFEAASRHVTSRDGLISSPIGLETLMLEAMYHINRGELRLAWLTFRRALAIAQMIGLDRMAHNPLAEALWFALMCGDRYLSLTLGLPLEVADNSFAVRGDDAKSALERFHAVVTGRLIARNARMQSCQESEDEETLDIDYSLKQAVKYVPGTWWVFEPLHNLLEEEVMKETMKTVTQMHHHYLIVLLHQPYLIHGLQYSTCSENVSYSKSALPSACRQVLLRFLVLRKYHRGVSYRGLDHKARLVATSLLLAHTEGHRHGRKNALEHQRPQDLEIINNVVGLIEGITVGDSGVQTLRRLIALEEDAANGTSYQWTNEGGMGLELKIPYFGTIYGKPAGLLGVPPRQIGPPPLSTGAIGNITTSTA